MENQRQEFYVTIDDQQIPASEEVYRVYKRKERSKRCIGKNGTGDCNHCDKLLLEELFKALDELDPDSRRICELISQGATEREITAVLGIRQKAYCQLRGKPSCIFQCQRSRY